MLPTFQMQQPYNSTETSFDLNGLSFRPVLRFAYRQIGDKITQAEGLLCILIRIESSFERHSKHYTIHNCSYNSTLKCHHVTYIVFINRSDKKLYDFARFVLDFESLSKPHAIRIEIHNSRPDLAFLIRISMSKSVPKLASISVPR